MIFIAVDGDDIGKKISFCYLRNDPARLKEINEIVQLKVKLVANYFTKQGFTVVFCAADGVTAYKEKTNLSNTEIYKSITDIAGQEISFSVGVGASLQEAYFALLFAKSSGKGRISDYKEIEINV